MFRVFFLIGFLCTLKTSFVCYINIVKTLCNVYFCNIRNLKEYDLYKSLNLDIFMKYSESLKIT